MNDCFVVRLVPSKILLWWLLWLHVVATSVVLVLSLPWWVKTILMGLFIISFYVSLRRHVWRVSGNSILTLVIQGERITAYLANHHKVLVSLTHHHLVANFVIALNLKLQGIGRESILILPDSSSKEMLRQLRVWLINRKWHVNA